MYLIGAQVRVAIVDRDATYERTRWRSNSLDQDFGECGRHS